MTSEALLALARFHQLRARRELDRAETARAIHRLCTQKASKHMEQAEEIMRSIAAAEAKESPRERVQ